MDIFCLKSISRERRRRLPWSLLRRARHQCYIGPSSSFSLCPSLHLQFIYQDEIPRLPDRGFLRYRRKVPDRGSVHALCSSSTARDTTSARPVARSPSSSSAARPPTPAHISSTCRTSPRPPSSRSSTSSARPRSARSSSTAACFPALHHHTLRAELRNVLDLQIVDVMSRFARGVTWATQRRRLRSFLKTDELHTRPRGQSRRVHCGARGRPEKRRDTDQDER